MESQNPSNFSLDASFANAPFVNDRAALRAACENGVGLCTIVGIEGSFSRRLGAQLAVHPDGRVTGSLSDGCLEKELASRILAANSRQIMRFGAGSSLVDFRLPCGGGLDILIDPAPNRDACRSVLSALDRRERASLTLPDGPLKKRHYLPALRLVLFGEGPELAALSAMAQAMGVQFEAVSKDASGMALGRAPIGQSADAFTAVILLFHDHEWEQAILEWALETPAFFIGAQGGFQAREERVARLEDAGISSEQIARIKSPIGLIARAKEPATLALSVLAQVVGEYEALHPHEGAAYG